MANAKFAGAAIDMRDQNFGLAFMYNDAQVLKDFLPLVTTTDSAGPNQISVTQYGFSGFSLESVTTTYWIKEASDTSINLEKYEISVDLTGGLSGYSGKFTMTPASFSGVINQYTYSNQYTGIKYVDISHISEKIGGSAASLDYPTIDSMFKGNDRIEGSEFSDYLKGLGGNDVIRGGDGDDCIDGGAGRDKLYGGAGADKFVFSEPAVAHHRDKIMDFNAAEGDGLCFDSGIYQNHGFAEVHRFKDKLDLSGEPVDHQGFIFESSSGKLYYDADGLGAGKCAEVVAQLVGVTHLTQDQLHFI